MEKKKLNEEEDGKGLIKVRDSAEETGHGRPVKDFLTNRRLSLTSGGNDTLLEFFEFPRNFFAALHF